MDTIQSTEDSWMIINHHPSLHGKSCWGYEPKAVFHPRYTKAQRWFAAVEFHSIWWDFWCPSVPDDLESVFRNRRLFEVNIPFHLVWRCTRVKCSYLGLPKPFWSPIDMSKPFGFQYLESEPATFFERGTGMLYWPRLKWSQYRRICHFQVGSGQARLNHTRVFCQCVYWQPLKSLLVPASICTRPSVPYEHFTTQINQDGRTGVHSTFCKSIELKNLVTLLVNTGSV